MRSGAHVPLLIHELTSSQEVGWSDHAEKIKTTGNLSFEKVNEPVCVQSKLQPAVPCVFSRYQFIEIFRNYRKFPRYYGLGLFPGPRNERGFGTDSEAQCTLNARCCCRLTSTQSITFTRFISETSITKPCESARGVGIRALSALETHGAPMA